MRKIISALLSLVMITGVFGGCSASDGTDNEINIALSSSPITVDPQLSFDTNASAVISFFTSTLYVYNTDHELVPGLAESCDVSDDGLTYTFHLKENLRWSDGRPLNAEDFVFGFRRLADPDVASNSVYLITDSCTIKNAIEVNMRQKPVNELGVSSPDDKTFVVELDNPCPYFTSLITLVNFSPCNEDFYYEVGTDYADRAENLLYCGPYIMDRYEPIAMQIHFTENPYYYRADEIKTHGITIQIVQNTQQAIMCYESGVVDITSVSGEYAELTEGDPELHVYPQALLSYIDFNHKNSAVLQNRNIRLALTKSIDRDDIVNNLLRTGYSPMTCITPPDFYKETDGTDYSADRSRYDEYARYDPDEAGRLWELGLSETGLSSVKLKIVYYSGNAALVEALTAQMKKTLPELDFEFRSVTMKERQRLYMAGEYDMMLINWVADYCDPTSFLNSFFTGYVPCGYSNDEYDDLILRCDSAEMAKNADERNKLLHKAEDILMENAAAIPLFTMGKNYLIHDGVEGFCLSPTGVNFIVTGLSKEVK